MSVPIDQISEKEAIAESFPKPAQAPARGSGPQLQIAVVSLSHEALLRKRSAKPMCRLSSAIHGSAQFRKALHDPLSQLRGQGGQGFWKCLEPGTAESKRTWMYSQRFPGALFALP